MDGTPAEVYEAYTDPRNHAAFTGDEGLGTPRAAGVLLETPARILLRQTLIARGGVGAKGPVPKRTGGASAPWA